VASADDSNGRIAGQFRCGVPSEHLHSGISFPRFHHGSGLWTKTFVIDTPKIPVSIPTPPEKEKIVERAENSDIIPSVPTGTEEDSLVKQTLWCQIKAFFEKGTTKTAIPRELSLDVKTVHKWLRRKWTAQERQRGPAPEVGYNAAVLLREVKGQGRFLLLSCFS
jgi:hypothetical protein